MQREPNKKGLKGRSACGTEREREIVRAGHIRGALSVQPNQPWLKLRLSKSTSRLRPLARSGTFGRGPGSLRAWGDRRVCPLVSFWVRSSGCAATTRSHYADKACICAYATSWTTRKSSSSSCCSRIAPPANSHTMYSLSVTSVWSLHLSYRTTHTSAGRLLRHEHEEEHPSHPQVVRRQVIQDPALNGDDTRDL